LLHALWHQALSFQQKVRVQLWITVTR
jgi:hypothetical protein